ncbi:DUF3243 domain-containing protein [Peribacillus simplex]|uniref:DUF3243 domain-containing protein n=2 Tax=Peribacillus simplex TaxID=1478 RepID=A0A223ED34_9BACI|nr:DUF3243 domain-containing protein [Peribacillus simplex]ASS93166.1 hypothetical protein BS1321_03845 [Peribacillus simplex NBRC 15720 = DSM 1321]MEC1399794.1 DUF3243 domain-containing protein [Peribacillus simplex]MED3909430.1 DUF3243 domain-containing protein [Peribacillus simplex]MED3982869.1 DUF3243 domain-containing protein [Peribacillus simplex]MED4096198.1 DUF3243 domain-containing protein [Peribacillus simplex]
MSVLDNWDQWKNFLGDRLNQGEQQGLSESAVNNLAFEIGDYLANQVEPQNDQEKVLSDLWSVASDEEKHAMANVMVKLVENNGTK